MSLDKKLFFLGLHLKQSFPNDKRGDISFYEITLSAGLDTTPVAICRFLCEMTLVCVMRNITGSEWTTVYEGMDIPSKDDEVGHKQGSPQTQQTETSANIGGPFPGSTLNQARKVIEIKHPYEVRLHDGSFTPEYTEGLLKFYITFGQQYTDSNPHPAGGHKDGWFEVWAVDEVSARQKIAVVMKNKWSSIYDTPPAPGLYKRGCLKTIY